MRTYETSPVTGHLITSSARSTPGQWGAGLFRDVIGLYLSPTRLAEEQWSQHLTYVLLAAEIERARRSRGELYDDVDSLQSAAFFLIGVHALLTTNREMSVESEDVVRKFVHSTLRSVQRPPG